MCFVAVSTGDLEVAIVTKASNKWLFEFTISQELAVTAGLFSSEIIFYTPYFSVKNLKMTVVL